MHFVSCTVCEFLLQQNIIDPWVRSSPEHRIVRVVRFVFIDIEIGSYDKILLEKLTVS